MHIVDMDLRIGNIRFEAQLFPLLNDIEGRELSY